MALPYRMSRWHGPDLPTEMEVVTRLEQEGATPVLRIAPPGYGEPPRRRPYAVILWVISGVLAVQFPGGNGAARAVLLRPGDRLDTQPGAVFGWSAAGAGHVCFAVVTPFCLPSVTGVLDRQPAMQRRSA